MIPSSFGLLAFLVALALLVAAATGLIAGSFASLIFRVGARLGKDALLGILGFFVAFMACLALRWPASREQYPYWISIGAAMLFPLLHEYSRVRHKNRFRTEGS
jgi:hypothetical protein